MGIKATRDGIWLVDGETGMAYLMSFQGQIKAEIKTGTERPTAIESDEVGIWVAGDEGKVRKEFQGEKIFTGTVEEETIAVDPYPNYSFAFTIKRARLDTHTNGGAAGAPNPDGMITKDDRFSNSLFELKVYIFKNFDDNVAASLANPETGGGSTFPPVPRGNRPIREFITLISL